MLIIRKLLHTSQHSGLLHIDTKTLDCLLDLYVCVYINIYVYVCVYLSVNQVS